MLFLSKNVGKNIIGWNKPFKIFPTFREQASLECISTGYETVDVKILALLQKDKRRMDAKLDDMPFKKC